jgi:hypothetical protein
MSGKDDKPETNWDQAVRRVAALAGFAGLAYGVGAVELWLRFATTGFPADLALSAEPRARVAIIGFRTLVTWCAITLVLLGVVELVSRALRRWGPEGNKTAVLTPTARGWLLALAAVAIVASAFTTWSVLTFVAGVTALAYGYGAFRKRYPSGRPLTPILAFIAVLSAVASIGWQLQVNLEYDAAKVTVKGKPPAVGIFFGTDDGNAYLALRTTSEKREGHFARDISVIPTSQIQSLQLRHGGQTLCTDVRRPTVSVIRVAQRVGRLVRQHLRQLGTPVATPTPTPTVTPVPAGRCPPG